MRYLRVFLIVGVLLLTTAAPASAIPTPKCLPFQCQQGGEVTITIHGTRYTCFATDLNLNHCWKTDLFPAWFPNYWFPPAFIPRACTVIKPCFA